MGKTLEVLRRDILCIMGETSRGKLSPASAQALVQYVKLLKELKEDEKDLLDGMTDKEIQDAIKENP
jgi:hypothetical protein